MGYVIVLCRNNHYVAVMFIVYMIANKRNGMLYLGHTDDLGVRIWEHKCKAHKGFAAKHDYDRLVWFETHATREAAFRRDNRKYQPKCP